MSGSPESVLTRATTSDIDLSCRIPCNSYINTCIQPRMNIQIKYAYSKSLSISYSDSVHRQTDYAQAGASSGQKEIREVRIRRLGYRLFAARLGTSSSEHLQIIWRVLRAVTGSSRICQKNLA
eukprot:2114462-Pleurochrysis_carterae.AAC.1